MNNSKIKIKKSKRSIRFLTFYFGLATNSRIKPSANFNVYFLNHEFTNDVFNFII